jgi:hypothetical protein
MYWARRLSAWHRPHVNAGHEKLDNFAALYQAHVVDILIMKNLQLREL